MTRSPNKLHETPSQTAGPYVHIGLAPRAAGFEIYKNDLGDDIAGPNAKGARIRVEGLVIDGTGEPVKDAVLEVWQANAKGIYAHPNHPGEVEPGFRGWGRALTDFDTGEWGFDTIKPGSVMGGAGQLMAPHINLWIVARGINIGLSTRLYFADEGAANATDPALDLINEPPRRETLIAQHVDNSEPDLYRFDIRLQGEHETVFFDT